MNEEEKKAIAIVENLKYKKYEVYIAKKMKNEIRFYQTEEEQKAIDTVIELIEKQQKEIEELKENQTTYKEFKEELKPLIKNEFINKDKIREKITYHKERAINVDNEFYKELHSFAAKMLEELLEESEINENN